MGVDYTAFVCWGQRVKYKRDLIQEIENSGSLLREYRVAYAEYGSRCYGGNGGYVLLLDGTYTEVDVKHDPDAKPLPRDRDWNQVDGVMRIQDVVHGLKKLGVDIETEGEPGWLVCGHVW